MNGMFIVFDGIDGSGKTTQVHLLAKYLRLQKQKVLTTFEPGGVTLGRALFKIILESSSLDPTAELFLLLADRIQHIKKIIIPHLQENYIVICDRFTASTIAYQGYGGGISLDVITNLNNIVCKDCSPALTFILNLPNEVAYHRIKNRGKFLNKFELVSHDYRERVMQGYRDFANSSDSGVIHVIDANRSVEDIHKELLALTEIEIHKQK